MTDEPGTNDERVLIILEDLLREEDVLATMISRQGFEGTSPSPDKFKLRDVGFWTLLQTTMGDFFQLITKFSQIGLDKVYFEMGEYEVIFYIIQGDVALVAVVPALCNRGLIEVELENARRAIKKVLG